MAGENTAIIWKDEFLEHDTGLHPEKKERLTAIRDRLSATDYYSNLQRPEPRFASQEEIATIHNSEYIQTLRDLCERKRSGFIDPDTPYSQGTFSAASLAAGSGLVLADKVWSGEAKNGLALVRPPGHHAVEEGAMGFCFFNNIAITARYLQSLGAKKILILDWDVHHGNGTEASFYEDDSIFFASLHQFPFYPGTGKASHTGKGKGLGTTLNCPLPRSSTLDDYKLEFDNKIIPAIDEFHPEIILISAGFDAHRDDPLGGMELTTQSFELFTRWIQDKANEHCSGKIISFLEGGYNLHALSESVEAHLSVLVG
ncbi:histone deacetylase family protein [Leptospira sp. GIMC2001]|uniref:histone deacetylase family protein n=1 Tax=Leptospira sp. GIMC2001 TaxID=1513297 RepID=UPI00234BEDA8|nr:histone deacetylase [Leptospira sp. GIMC2001]WCL50324.1 histone deacetylase [Leptospira sp. GIMC2001]